MQTKALWTTTLTCFLVPVMSTVLGGGLAAQSGPKMSFAGFDKLQSAAADVVDVSLDSGLLMLAAKFMQAGDKEEAAVKSMLSGLKGIYVRSYEFKDDGGFGPADVEPIRRQLTGPGWSRMAGVRSSKERADVDVYLWLDGERVGGLGILASEPRRFTVVNIVGTIDLDHLRRLEGFGLPRLGIERMKDKADKIEKIDKMIDKVEKVEKVEKPKDKGDKPKGDRVKPGDEDEQD
jgi:hypothetical protein